MQVNPVSAKTPFTTKERVKRSAMTAASCGVLSAGLTYVVNKGNCSAKQVGRVAALAAGFSVGLDLIRRAFEYAKENSSKTNTCSEKLMPEIDTSLKTTQG